MKSVRLILVFLLISFTHAQLTHSFIKKASLHYDASAHDVAIGADGTIFIAYHDRLQAYSYDGQSFNLLASIGTGAEGMDLEIGPDSTIFLANMWDGLRAYTFQDNQFVYKASVHHGGDAHGIALGSDNIIFVANLSDGLRAYTYNGSSFTHQAHYNNNYDAHDVAVGPDGTIFLANAWDGLRAFTYNGTSFSHIAHIYDGRDNDGHALAVEVDASGTIFLGNGRDGLRAYTFSGNSFTNTAHINYGGEARGVTIDEYGTIYLANGNGGLRAYVYDGKSFFNTAHVKEEGDSRNVTVDSDGTVFVANHWQGVFSYSYTGYGDIPLFFVSPNYCFRDNQYTASVSGHNTHFSDEDGASQIWISNKDVSIEADDFQINSNTSLDVEFTIPSDTPIDLWDMNIRTAIDSIITMKNMVSVVLDSNYALKFDGINDYISVQHRESMQFSKEITFEAWIRPESWQCNPWIFQKGEDDRLVVRAEEWDEGSFKFVINGNYLEVSLPPLHEWTHVSCVYDGVKSKIYMNGECLDSLYINEPIEQRNDPLLIGTNHVEAGECEFFHGQLDEIRLWNRALNQQEIRANMYTYLSGSEDSLVGYWTYNEGTGSRVADLTDNNNNGTIYGARWTASGSPIGTVYLFCYPVYAYQNHNFYTTIQGANTYFASGIQSIWISKDGQKISSIRYEHRSNTLVDARFMIPPDAATGEWAINVETIIDSIITIPLGVEILPPPSVSSQRSSASSWLRSVYALNDNLCWIAGSDGSIQKTIDGGTTWETQTSGTSDVLYASHFTDNQTGWVVGQYGTIVNTDNGGLEWNTQSSGTSNNLQTVHFINNHIGWSAGRSGTILKTTDGGMNWNAQNSGVRSWLYSITFVDENKGWVVGSNGTILSTADGGNIWYPQNSSTSNYLSSIFFYDSNIGWVVGSNGTILKTTDGGNLWTPLTSRTNEWLKAVYFRNPQTGWAVGTNGILLMTDDGGYSWSPRKTWTTRSLNSIHFADDITGWVVGETGTIFNLKMNNLATAIKNEDNLNSIPQDFKLLQNYPNPFNPTTIISYQLPVTSYVNLSVYNLLGQKVVTLVSEREEAGYHHTEWDARQFSSGVYFYVLTTREFRDVKKMILVH